MRPDALVNQGAYVALIDKNKCDAAKESSAGNSGDSSGASQAPQLHDGGSQLDPHVQHDPCWSPPGSR